MPISTGKSQGELISFKPDFGETKEGRGFVLHCVEDVPHPLPTIPVLVQELRKFIEIPIGILKLPIYLQARQQQARLC